MTTQFSYQSLRCIIEYVEANKRIHICARSELLRKIDKAIPLHVDHLFLSDNSICLNDILFFFSNHSFSSDSDVYVDGDFREGWMVATPGDIRLDTFSTSSRELQTFKLDSLQNLEIRKPLPVTISYTGRFGMRSAQNLTKTAPDLAYKVMMCKLLGQRGTIYVSKLEVRTFMVMLPESIKFRIRNSLATGDYDFTKLLPIIDPQSFPLKKIEMSPWKSEMYHHPVVQTATDTIEIWSHNNNPNFLEPWHIQVLALPHRHIVLDRHRFNEGEMLSVIQDWLEHPREVGYSLKVGVEQNLGEEWRLLNFAFIKTRFNGTFVTIRNHDDTERVYEKAVAIPLSSTSELLVCGAFSSKMKLEVIPLGLTTPINTNNVTYQESIQLYFHEHQKHKFWVLVALVSLIVLVFGFVLYYCMT